MGSSQRQDQKVEKDSSWGSRSHSWSPGEGHECRPHADRLEPWPGPRHQPQAGDAGQTRSLGSVPLLFPAQPPPAPCGHTSAQAEPPPAPRSLSPLLSSFNIGTGAGSCKPADHASSSWPRARTCSVMLVTLHDPHSMVFLCFRAPGGADDSLCVSRACLSAQHRARVPYASLPPNSRRPY